MGDRYVIQITCPKCDREDEAYYAPTCGYDTWICKKCHYEVDLEEYTGISKESCSNAARIQKIIDELGGEEQG